MARKRKKIKRFIFSSKGTITFKILIAVVIIGSIALVSGVFPKNQITPQDPNAPRYKPKIEDETLQKRSIQLKTIGFETCSETVAVEMIIDRSNSMQATRQKLINLRESSATFLQKLTDDAPVGLVTFADDAKEEFKIQPYKDIKISLDSFVKTLEVRGNTNTEAALLKAKEALDVGQPKFPGRQFVVVLVTDGVPTRGGNPVAAASQIKNMGVKIYTIGITEKVTNRQTMISLMKAVSSPDAFFEAPDTTTLNEIYDQIGSELCQPAK